MGWFKNFWQQSCRIPIIYTIWRTLKTRSTGCLLSHSRIYGLYGDVVRRNLFRWCIFDTYWFLGYVSELGHFRESLLRFISMCCVWCQYDSSLFYYVLFFFTVGVPSFKFLFFVVEEVYSSLVSFFRPSCYSVSQNCGVFLTWSKDRYLRLVLI